VRINRGKLKRIRFFPPKGFPSRPTTDFAKEGLFNLLENQFDMFDMAILDLFAGTGNISFEFASREAGRITAVDRNYKCIRFISEFAKKHELQEVEIVKSDAFKFVGKTPATFDLVFADPPFKSNFYESLINAVFENEILNKNGVFILEHEKRINFESHPCFDSARKYGNVVFSFFS